MRREYSRPAHIGLRLRVVLSPSVSARDDTAIDVPPECYSFNIERRISIYAERLISDIFMMTRVNAILLHAKKARNYQPAAWPGRGNKLVAKRRASIVTRELMRRNDKYDDAAG